MTRNVVIFGGSFDPPHLMHREIAQALVDQGYEVVAFPCGIRSDKDVRVDPAQRATYADLTFGKIPGVTVDLTDLEGTTFRRTVEVDAYFREKFAGQEVEIFHAIGTDLIRGGATGASEIQQAWYQGKELWNTLKFLIIERPEKPAPVEDDPPHSKRVHTCSRAISSTDIRNRIATGQPFEHLVPLCVAEQIERYRSYRSTVFKSVFSWEPSELKFLSVYDARNPKAVTLMERFAPLCDPDHATAILVIGGDGMMVDAVADHWRRRLPFVGLNAGRRGFLLNDPESILAGGVLPTRFDIHHLPLLHAEIETESGERQEVLAVNDVWMERMTSQSAMMEVLIDGELVIRPFFMGDSLICATPNGTTAYAGNAGGPCLDIGSPELALVGVAPARWLRWNYSVLPQDVVIEMKGLEIKKRPLRVCWDARQVDHVTRVCVRRSNSASFQLAYFPGKNQRQKRMQFQFPDGSFTNTKS